MRNCVNTPGSVRPFRPQSIRIEAVIVPGIELGPVDACLSPSPVMLPSDPVGGAEEQAVPVAILVRNCEPVLIPIRSRSWSRPVHAVAILVPVCGRLNPATIDRSTDAVENRPDCAAMRPAPPPETATANRACAIGSRKKQNRDG